MRWAVQRSDELLEKELRMKWSFGREMNQRLWAFRLRRMYREGLEPWAAVPFSRSGLPIGVQNRGCAVRGIDRAGAGACVRAGDRVASKETSASLVMPEKLVEREGIEPSTPAL